MAAPTSIAISGTSRDVPRVPDARVTYAAPAGGTSAYVVSAATPEPRPKPPT
jgi:hypothetical protein